MTTPNDLRKDDARRPPTFAPAELRSARILAVDDNPVNVDMIVDIVAMGGYEVIPAFDGPSALLIARTEMPDLMILDVNMPGMSGFEVCQTLKLDPDLKNIQVIMLTALNDVDSRVDGLEAGADDYLTKPYSARELIARVEARLRAKAEADQLRVMQHTIRDTFERFVSSNVVDQLLQDPTNVKLGGKLQEVTVMFADLEGFTPLSERTPPDELLTILNAYHELIVGLILEHGGTIDKFLGDGVMALFNTPLEQADHVNRAVQAALTIRDTLPFLYRRYQPDFQLRVNFGIHTGLAIVGNVGTQDIMDFTAVGDVVNVAARLQDRSSDGQILVSQAVHDLVADYAFANRVGPINLKGRTGSVVVYEVTGHRDPDDFEDIENTEDD